MRPKIKIDFNAKVSTHFAFMIVLILSFLVAWYTIATGEKIISNAPNSPVFNLEKRVSPAAGNAVEKNNQTIPAKAL